MKTLNIIKIGGKVIDDIILLKQFIQGFKVIPEPKILVHGGGKSADQHLLTLGIKPNMVNGRRITDRKTLEIVAMCYSYLNKKIVSLLQSYSIDSLGLSGSDGNIIRAHKRMVKDIDYGFVGDIDTIEIQKIIGFLKNNFVPVFCALTHDGNGQLLNTNADTIASELAVSLSNDYNVNLIYCFDVDGVMDFESEKLIEDITLNSFELLKQQGKLTGGIIPKIENALSAVSKGVSKVIIANSNALENYNTESFIGTSIHD